MPSGFVYMLASKRNGTLYTGVTSDIPARMEQHRSGKGSAFVKKYKVQFGKDPNFAAQIGYTAAELTVQALKNAGKDLTVDSFVTGMESIKNWQDKFGAPPMTFSATKHQGSNESFLCVVKSGKWVPISTSPFGY